MYVYIYIFTYTYKCVSILSTYIIGMYADACVCKNMYMVHDTWYMIHDTWYTYTCTKTHTFDMWRTTQRYIDIYISIYIFTCIYIYIYICIYVYILHIYTIILYKYIYIYYTNIYIYILYKYIYIIQIYIYIIHIYIYLYMTYIMHDYEMFICGYTKMKHIWCQETRAEEDTVRLGRPRAISGSAGYFR